MKVLVWTVFVIGLLLWTAGTWAVAELTRWAAGIVASGEAVDWAETVGALRWPAWLTLWLDPALIESMIDTVVTALEWARRAMPWFGSVAGWVVAALWVVWGIGALLWLALAGGLHLLVGRLSAPRAAAA